MVLAGEQVTRSVNFLPGESRRTEVESVRCCSLTVEEAFFLLAFEAVSDLEAVSAEEPEENFWVESEEGLGEEMAFGLTAFFLEGAKTFTLHTAKIFLFAVEKTFIFAVPAFFALIFPFWVTETVFLRLECHFKFWLAALPGFSVVFNR